jgi:signal peptide peptidase SppA
MPAIPGHDTDVIDEPWDADAEVGKIPNDAGEATLRRMYAWVDPDGDPKTKAAYKLPHHKVVDAEPRAANLNGVRNALSRLPQSDIPESDHDGVRSHLQRHLDAQDSGGEASSVGSAADGPPLPSLMPLGRAVWAITEHALGRVAAAQRRLVATPAVEGVAARVAAGAPRAARRTAGTRAGGAVAVLPLTGLLTPRGSLISLLFGGGYGGLQAFREAFREAIADPDVGAIVLDVDSPGGVVHLVPETAAEIWEARGTKPIVAVSNTLAASGAYWIASQADELVVTPSGEVGSIGVYYLHESWAGWNEQAGIEPTYIYAGKYKTEGNPDEPLSDEAREAWQQDADDLYAMFLEGVAAGRGVSTETVRSEYGEGRTLLAERALAAGMVDRISTLETVVRELLTPTGGAGARTDSSTANPAPRAENPSPPTSEPPADSPADPGDGANEPPVPAPETETEPPAEASPEPDSLDSEARAAIAAVLI